MADNAQQRKQAGKSYRTVAIILAVFFSFFLLMSFVILTIMSNDFPTFGKIKFVVLGGVILIAIASFFGLYASYKGKVKILETVIPHQCVLEDFLIIRYKRNKRLHYKANPVVKDNMGRLYCLFFRDNLSFYTSIVSCGVNGVAKADIIRNDGSKVKIGDAVALYITDSANNAGLQVNDDKTY